MIDPVKMLMFFSTAAATLDWAVMMLKGPEVEALRKHVTDARTSMLAAVVEIERIRASRPR